MCGINLIKQEGHLTQNETDLSLLQAGLDTATLSKDPQAIVAATGALIKYHQGRGDVAACVACTKSLLPYLMKPEWLNDLVRNLSYLGKCHSLLEEFDAAEDAYLQALKIYMDRNIELGVAEVESDLGILFRHRGAFDISLSHLTKAIDIYKDNLSAMETSQNPQPWISYINAIECTGIIYGQLHQYEKSIQFLEAALHLREQHGNPVGRVSALMNLGVTYSEFDPDKAKDYYLQALTAFDDRTPVYHKVVLLSNLGGCLEDKGSLEDALQYYLEASKLMSATGQYHYQAHIHKHLGSVYFKQGKYDQALLEIEKSLSVSQQTGAKSEIKDCYLALSDIYLAKSEYHTALDYRVKYDVLKDEVYRQDLSVQLSELQKKYEQTTLSVSSLRQEKSLITEELKKLMHTGFVGVSQSIREVQRLALEASLHKDTRVLITGESGVGKEIVARLIHYSDTLSRGRFVDVNCCSIPDTMLESEFFGYVRGAFTGAISNKAGYLEEAHQGTLFLDEIGDMPVFLQGKLLRVLETKQVKKLGSNKSAAIEFRLLSATNKDLNELIRANQFRADLLYRINTVQINIPPLRERPEDILPLMDYYLNEYARRMNKATPQFGQDVITSLHNYSFPGNVRELRNMIEKAMIFLKGNRLVGADFTSQMRNSETVVTPAEAKPFVRLQDIETDTLLKTLARCGGNQTLAAKEMGISYATFKRKYKKLRTD
jgi:transcriptional regulator with PAS, ATPase and Fis domain